MDGKALESYESVKALDSCKNPQNFRKHFPAMIIKKNCDSLHSPWKFQQLLIALKVFESCKSSWTLWKPLKALNAKSCGNHEKLAKPLKSVTYLDICDSHWHLWRPFIVFESFERPSQLSKILEAVRSDWELWQLLRAVTMTAIESCDRPWELLWLFSCQGSMSLGPCWTGCPRPAWGGWGGARLQRNC